jgi:hypothetical protein
VLCLALAYGIEPICYGIIFLVAMGAIFVGTLLIAVFPWLATALPSWLGSR